MLLGRNYDENGELTGAGSEKVTAGSRAQVASLRSASASMFNVDGGLLDARSIRVETKGGEIVCGTLSSGAHRDDFRINRATVPKW